LDKNRFRKVEQEVVLYAKKVRAIFADGFQWRDLPDIVVCTIELVGGLSNTGNRELVTKIVDKVIDISDTPFLPDNLTDPIFKLLARSLVNFTFNVIDKSVPLNNPLLSGKEMFASAPFKEDLQCVAHKIKDLFQDGFQWEDLTQMIAYLVEFVNEFPAINEPQKRAYVIQILEDVIDMTDTPYLPDNVFDPLFKYVVPSFVDYVIYLTQHT
jgi:hypothetical protein